MTLGVLINAEVVAILGVEDVGASELLTTVITDEAATNGENATE